MERLKMFLTLSKLLFLLLAAVNFALCAIGMASWGFSILSILVWSAGLLSSLGYIKRFVKKEGTAVTYEIIIPIVPIGIVRMLQVLLNYYLLKLGYSSIALAVVVVLDVIYVVFLAICNATSCFESVREDTEYDAES